MSADEQTGVHLIAAERWRQVEREGWTPEHDDLHDNEELAFAAACYALPPGPHRHNEGDSLLVAPFLWPWDNYNWKPSSDRVRDLVKAGALIAAEIDRRLRARPE